MRLLANTTHLLANEISAATADEEAKTDFLEGPIHHAPFADRIEAAVRKDPALADLTNEKGERAIDLACLDCRRAMQRALFFLGRYDVDKGPPEHRSATSLVVRAVDHAAADDYGKLFVEFDKDSNGTLDLSELEALAAKLGEILKLEDGESYMRSPSRRRPRVGLERVRNGPSVGGSFAARWARMVLKRCSSERGEREKRFYGDGKGERRRTAL